ncbi:MAG TPA: glycoside hydrolase family 88 protein [Gemmataceae bacterium]|jgi:unsaturated chondroitin disaccharide hydrolase|nr:glycoside hydrolase family 88 protein [Gemmataceae bacterium]
MFEQTLDFAAAQARRIVAAYPAYAPMYTVGGRWNREGERWTSWCEGFFPGILWLLHEHTGDADWRRLAEQYTRPLEPRRFDRAVHDLGFLFQSTYLRWYRLTGAAAPRDVLIDAGRTLALRRQKGGYLASFIGPQSLFIDIMMNVGLIFWTADATGDSALLQIALEHCHTTARHLVRPDGGTAHEGVFDVETGRFLRTCTHQGWSADSTWSRGLAWAIYGFTAAARLSGEAEFLTTARRCADFYLSRVPPGMVPYWDFDIPEDGPRLWDSSAAAVTASGLWDLAEAVGESNDRDRYRAAALTILQTLCSHEFLPRHHPEWEGILMHAVYHYPKGLGVDESVAWGDYFFVEALLKATRREERG